MAKTKKPEQPPAKLAVTCTYFKPTGEFVLKATARYYTWRFEGCVSAGDIGRRLMELRRMPGQKSGIWNGPYICHPADRPPQLIDPANPAPHKPPFAPDVVYTIAESEERLGLCLGGPYPNLEEAKRFVSDCPTAVIVRHSPVSVRIVSHWSDVYHDWKDRTNPPNVKEGHREEED